MAALGGEARRPWVLPREGGGFVVLFQSDFFSGRRQSAAWRAFDGQGEPVGEAAPGFPDFLSIPDSVGGVAPDGTLLIGGWGQGPASHGFFLQASSVAGDPLGEPTHLKTAGEVVEAALRWSSDADAFLLAYVAKGIGRVRRLGRAGRPLGAEVELGPSKLAPRIDGGRVLTIAAAGDDRYRVVERALSGLRDALAAGSPITLAEGAASSPLLRAADGWVLYSVDDGLHVRPAAEAPR